MTQQVLNDVDRATSRSATPRAASAPRRSHLKAAVDLARLAGLPEAAVGEVVNDDGTTARLPELWVFADTHDLAPDPRSSS